MKSKPNIIVLLITFMSASCAPTVQTTDVIKVVTSTAIILPTYTPEPTRTPASSTEAPITPTEAGPKNGDTKTVTESGHNYTYTYNAEFRQWVRKVGDFYLFDWPDINAIRYRINITENAVGERSIYQITHKDFTMADVPSGGIFNPPPITATFSPKLREITGKDLPTLIKEMQGNGIDLVVHVLDGTPEGKTEHIKLSTQSGLILTIIDKDSLFEIGGENVSMWRTFGNVTVYSQVYGVDNAGNMLVRFAIDGSLTDVSDKDLRNILFSFPANMIENTEQSNHGITTFTQTLTIVSLQSPKDGTPSDLVIDRIPLSQP